MSRDEALELIKLWQRWNNGQTSISLAFGGPRTDEDDIYDARRRLLKQAFAVMEGEA